MENSAKAPSDYIVSGPPTDYVPSPKGIGYETFHSMKLNQNVIAQIDAETGESDTYGSLLQRCIRTSLKLLSKGIARDEVICLCTSNHLNSCVPVLSSLFLGVKIAPLDPSLSVDDTAYLLKLVDPKFIFVSNDHALDLIENALHRADLKGKIVVFADSSEKYETFAAFIQPQLEEEAFEPLPISSNRETALIIFSSGTTGLPKGICLSHYALLAQLVNTADLWNLGKRFYFSNYGQERQGTRLTVTLGFSTFYWISAFGILNCSNLTGITRIVCAKYDPQKVLRYIDKYKIEFICCASIHAVGLCQAAKPPEVDTTTLQVLQTGGAPLSLKNMLELRKLFPSAFISNAYGQTEISGGLTMFNASKPQDVRDQYEKPSSCGRLTPGIQCKIVNIENDELLGPNQPGELRYKCEFMMNGYYNSDSTCDEVFDREGWCRTGDIAYYDEDLCFYIVDRIKDMFKYKGWHIVPAVLEAILSRHPDVKEAVVIGIPHGEFGDLPMGLVTLNANSTVKPEEIQEFVDERVSDTQKLRGGIKIIKEMPITPTGKLKRKELKDLVLAGQLKSLQSRSCCNCTIS